MRDETCCLHYMGYSFQLAASDLLFAPSHRHDNTYHGLCCTISGALAEMRNSSLGPPGGIDLMTYSKLRRLSTTELGPAPYD